MGKIERIQVPPEDRERLVRLVKDRNTPQKIVWRSQIVLLAGAGIEGKVGQEWTTRAHSYCSARIRGFPNRRKDASLPLWARSNASRFLLKIGSGL